MKRFIALALALLMVLALCACGGKEETPAAEAAPAAPAAPAEGEAAPPAAGGEASGEATGEAQSFELFPMDGYDKTFEGYKQWAIAAINSTDGPPDIKAQDVANIEAMTEAEDTSATTLSMYIGWGLVTDYQTFLK